MSEVAAAAPAATEATTAEPGTAPAPKTDAPPPAQVKRKIKVFGEERELSQDEIDQYASAGFAAGKKFEEAAKLRKDADALVSKFKSNPKGALRELMKESPELQKMVRSQVEELLYEELEAEKLSPEQRRIKELEAKLQAEEDAKRAAKESEEAKAFEALQKQAHEDISNTIVTTLNKTGLPKTPYTVKRMAEYLKALTDNGVDFKSIDLDGVGRHVRDQYLRDFQEFTAQMKEADQILNFFPKEMLDRIRKADLARLKGRQKPAEPIKQPEKTRETTKKRFLTEKELMRDISDKIKK